jgi:hypothetical protein
MQLNDELHVLSVLVVTKQVSVATGVSTAHRYVVNYPTVCGKLIAGYLSDYIGR